MTDDLDCRREAKSVQQATAERLARELVEDALAEAETEGLDVGLILEALRDLAGVDDGEEAAAP